MSSTNKTPNYNLSQFTADDKPAWLSDYNSDMQKIDTQMKANATKVDSAEKTANNANTASSSALETATEAKTLASGASTNASTALSTAQSANQTAQTASQNAQTAKDTANTASGLASSANSNAQNANTNANKAINDLKKFNLINSKIWENSDIYAGQHISNIVNSTINLAYDSTSKVFKLYGEISCAIEANTTGEIVLSNSPLRPSEEITIGYAGISYLQNTPSVDFVNFVVKTTGEIVIRIWNGIGGNIKIGLFNCLYFLESFDQSLVDPS